MTRVSIDLKALRRRKDVSYYFRYELRPHDFHELRRDGRLVGRYTAKPLYDALTSDGHVDRRASYSGRIAVLFIPPRVRTPARVQLLFGRMPAAKVRKANGAKDWAKIRIAAERAILARRAA